MSALVETTAGDYERESVRGALLAIADGSGGVATPEAVVLAAQSKDSPLHEFFEWDDSEAAAKFRLVQAGALIRRVKLTVIRASVETKIIDVGTTRAFVSPANERRSAKNPEGGYSRIEHVLSDDERRKALIDTVRAELAAIKAKYSALSELSQVWQAIDAI